MVRRWRASPSEIRSGPRRPAEAEGDPASTKSKICKAPEMLSYHTVEEVQRGKAAGNNVRDRVHGFKAFRYVYTRIYAPYGNGIAMCVDRTSLGDILSGMMARYFLIAYLVLAPLVAADLWPTDRWKESTPEEQGADSASLADAIDYIVQKRLPIHSMLVVRHGAIVVDAYFFPYDSYVFANGL